MKLKLSGFWCSWLGQPRANAALSKDHLFTNSPSTMSPNKTVDSSVWPLFYLLPAALCTASAHPIMTLSRLNTFILSDYGSSASLSTLCHLRYQGDARLTTWWICLLLSWRDLHPQEAPASLGAHIIAIMGFHSAAGPWVSGGRVGERRGRP